MGGKVVLVTGAGSGIGRAVCQTFLEAGHSLAVMGRRLEPLEESVAGAAKGHALVFPGDVANPEAVETLFAEIKRAFGRIDVVFNNAGIFTPGNTIDDISVEEWRQALDVNLTGSFLVARQAFKMMKMQDPQGGRIINNGSISAHAPRPGSVPYTTTKHAITGLTKTLSLDGRPFNIACGQIDIGNAETPMTSKIAEGVPQADGTIKGEAVMDVAHVARAVLQMAELPLDANIQFMTIMATKMPFIGRG